jgi:glycosyltransferase involved in cell wall biosynthesis
MQYIIIMPAYNEERHIGVTLESLTRQTHLPRQLIVVNDGSSDRTGEIARKYAARHAWINVVDHPAAPRHSPGAKVVRAFYFGYGQIPTDARYEFIVKLDADLELPPHYFERVAEMFAEDPLLGIAGGISLVEKKGEWVYEAFADKDHVRGPYKSYRRACFEAIGGLRPSVGWDSADEMLAIYHGWHTRTDTRLTVKHFRPTGAETGALKVKVKMGWAWYRMRYGFFVALVSAAKSGLLNKPYLLTGLAGMAGWLQAWLRGDEFIVSPEEGRFIRRYRRGRMLGKLRGVFSAYRVN